jgi:hypothetical protein
MATPNELSADERRREVAAVLAKGVARWRQRAKAGGFTPSKETCPQGEKGLEVSGDLRLSVTDRPAG